MNCETVKETTIHAIGVSEETSEERKKNFKVKCPNAFKF